LWLRSGSINNAPMLPDLLDLIRIKAARKKGTLLLAGFPNPVLRSLRHTTARPLSKLRQVAAKRIEGRRTARPAPLHHEGSGAGQSRNFITKFPKWPNALID
jgi:hypothetical protein